MDGKEEAPGAQVREQLAEVTESERLQEHRFISGYMGLMRCTEPAARAVFAHIPVRNGEGRSGAA